MLLSTCAAVRVGVASEPMVACTTSRAMTSPYSEDAGLSVVRIWDGRYEGVRTTSTKHATTMSLTKRSVRELQVRYTVYLPDDDPRYPIHSVVV